MAITNQDKKWRENMKRWKRGIALLAIVAMMMQVLPINVWAEPVADEICIKGAKGLAMTGLDLLLNESLRQAAAEYHEKVVPDFYKEK